MAGVIALSAAGGTGLLHQLWTRGDCVPVLAAVVAEGSVVVLSRALVSSVMAERVASFAAVPRPVASPWFGDVARRVLIGKRSRRGRWQRWLGLGLEVRRSMRWVMDSHHGGGRVVCLEVSSGGFSEAAWKLCINSAWLPFICLISSATLVKTAAVA